MTMTFTMMEAGNNKKIQRTNAQKNRTRRRSSSSIKNSTDRRHTGHQRIQLLALTTTLALLAAVPVDGTLTSVGMEGLAPAEKDSLSTAEPVTFPEDDEIEPNQPSTQQTHYCRWGDKDCHHRESPTNENRSATYKSEQQMADTIGSVIKKAAAMSSDAESVHAPPEGFTLAARVLTDHDTGLSYFAPLSSPSDLQIPFLECGAVGSTTEPIEIKHGTFRHFPSGADPSSFTTSPHAQLVVALHPLELTVSGNKQESRVFHPGDVILLEDTMGKGHKMRALSSGEEKGQYGEERDLSVFMLTLPHHHHHHHEKGNSNIIANHMSVFGLPLKQHAKNSKPCENVLDSTYSDKVDDSKEPNIDVMGFYTSPFERFSPRRMVIGALGAGMTFGSAFWLAEVAPIIPVCVGATCFVAGATCAAASLGEKIVDAYETARERKRFSASDLDEEED